MCNSALNYMYINTCTVSVHSDLLYLMVSVNHVCKSEAFVVYCMNTVTLYDIHHRLQSRCEVTHQCSGTDAQ